MQHTADQLIDVGTGLWDNEKVQANFISTDAAAIMRIPVNLTMDDFWAWQPEKFGGFMVRSAYRLLVNQRRIK